MTMHYDPRPDAAEASPVSGRDAAGPGPGSAGTRDGAIRDAFDIADALFRDAAEDFDRLRRRLRSEDGVTAKGGAAGRGRATKPVDGALGEGLKEAVRLARDLRAATQLMLEERNRVDRLRKEIAGGVDGGGALDLDAARDEIGRRLACLRRAAGG